MFKEDIDRQPCFFGTIFDVGTKNVKKKKVFEYLKEGTHSSITVLYPLNDETTGVIWSISSVRTTYL